MRQIDKAHSTIARRPCLTYKEEISESEVKKFLLGLWAYILILVCLTAFFIYDAIAQDINDLVPDDTIKIDGLVIRPQSAVTDQNDAVSSPDGDEMEGAPAWPDLDYNNFTPAQISILKNLELKNTIKKGLIPADAKLRFLGSKRDIHEDLKLYSNSIKWHVRAINEGREVNYYIDYIKAGRTPEEQSARMAVLVRDAELCGYGFEIFEGSGICNVFPTPEQCEQNYYACGETLNREINKYSSCELSNFQIGVAFTNLQNQICENAGRMADGPNGRLWKPDADPDASCAGGTTILLDPSLGSVNKIQVLNSNKELVAVPEYFGFFEGGRPRFCIRGRAGAEFGPYSVHVKYRTPDADKCFLVADPSKRED